MQIESTIFIFMTKFTRKNIFKCCLLLNMMPNYPYRMPCTIFSCFLCYKETKKNKFWVCFARSCPFYLKMLNFSSLNQKILFLEIFLKSNILCTKILGTVKFFLKSKNFLTSNMLKSKIHCTMTPNLQE